MDATDKEFIYFLQQHPTYWPAVQAEAHRRLAAGEEKLSMKAIFETLRPRHRHLNNTFTAPMARHAMRNDPLCAGRFETRSSPERRR